MSDFYAKYTDNNQKLTQFQRLVFAASRKISPVKTAIQGDVQEEETSEVVYGDTASLADIYGSPNPPQLSNGAMPRFVRDATGPVPVEAKETAAQAMFPPLGMYCDASFVYIDNTLREPRANCLIIAGTGGGKDSSTKHMLKHLETPQKKEDGPNRIVLEKYKQECNRRNQNLDKPERPNVAVRSVAADITKARLSELMADSQGKIVHTRMVELDQWFAVEGYKPGPNCPFTYMKMTDDEDNPFGQERVGSQSVTYQGPLSINWNASTTPSKAAYYFRNAMTDGPISRLQLATVPDRGLGAPMPVHGKYDEKYDAKLKPYIDNLRQAHGVIDCRQARRMVERLKDELDDFVVKSVAPKSGTVASAGTKPAIIQHKHLDTAFFGFRCDLKDQFFTDIKLGCLPVIDQDRTRFVTPWTPDKSRSVEAVKTPAHPVQSLIRIDHDRFRSLERITRFQLPFEPVGINAHQYAGKTVLVHMYLSKKVPAVNKRESEHFPGVFGRMDAFECKKRIMLMG